MIDEQITLGIDDSKVVHETLDGEAIIIHLESGIYYSLDKVGAATWQLLLGGNTIAQVVDALAEHYGAPRSVVTGDVNALVEGLTTADLLRPVSRDNSESALVDAWPDGDYASPHLEAYRDMEYFLLLDPVHDVDQAGWPHAPSRAAGVPAEFG